MRRRIKAEGISLPSTTQDDITPLMDLLFSPTSSTLHLVNYEWRGPLFFCLRTAHSVHSHNTHITRLKHTAKWNVARGIGSMPIKFKTLSGLSFSGFVFESWITLCLLFLSHLCVTLHQVNHFLSSLFSFCPTCNFVVKFTSHLWPLSHPVGDWHFLSSVVLNWCFEFTLWWLLDLNDHLIFWCWLTCL